MFVTIQRKLSVVGTPHHLPSSKSISNRALLINALTGNQSVVSNLSDARDTQLMQALVNLDERTIDVKDAGTTMRFLTSYFALSGKNKLLTGTERMKERPIALLVDALRLLGASIEYRGMTGFPPIETTGFSGQKVDVVTLPGNVSSQYISALMMMAPQLPSGLTIRIRDTVGSVPYIEMTAAIMRSFGATVEFNSSEIRVNSGGYTPSSITVEADWSAASYWYGFVALAETAEVTLPNVTRESLQGDRVIVEVMEKLGVTTTWTASNAVLTKRPHSSSVEWDFKDCPDLAQTVLPVCAAKKITGTFTGMESLRIKETDRIAALQTELAKIGADLIEPTEGRWKLIPGKPGIEIAIETYHDHRMAMGLAPLAAIMPVRINDPDVVNKSYPGFWQDMKEMGFDIATH